MARNPHYFSQLAHIEIYATNIEASINFFTDIVGLDELVAMKTLFTSVRGAIIFITRLR
jgi:catechol 2,3-dioxygenase-like lactoylglutathione lyase family enzyme